ncbi:MAG: hypothetical protein M3220_02725, partial [Chloroflexota bacterium]|nr:hypothetical protein [Chloroflexota bacterium]
MRKLLLITMLLALTLVLLACGGAEEAEEAPAEPEVITEVQEVEVTRIVEGETETVVEEVEVVVTATPSEEELAEQEAAAAEAGLVTLD